MLHCGASEVKYHELRDIPVTNRVHQWIGKQGQVRTLQRTERWAGIQHYDFASSVLRSCELMGMPVDENRTRWGVSNEGADLFGYLKFQTEVMGRPTIVSRYFTSDVEPGMGLRHSNRSKFSAQGTIGGSVFVCDNLVITGSFLFRKRHTVRNVENLRPIITDGMREYIDSLPDLGAMVTNLQQKWLTAQDLASVYLRAGRQKVMPWSHIGEVDKYWNNPTHEAFTKREDGWRLYNAFNTVAKKYNPSRQFDVVSRVADCILPKQESQEKICY
tara:strand:- start:2073 stop:2891 length:819 start_codon:yes stop_codon:yes gene_type:complete